MAKKMLIDSTHSEETRVVVVNGNKVEEFDFDSTARSLITGNIYLAKVSRIEPSLQAAFVDYGGNRQGFLAFSEIHPDYYQIPQADREALMQEELERQAEEAEEEEAEDEKLEEENNDKNNEKRGKSRSRRRSSRKKNIAQSNPEETIQGEIETPETADENDADESENKNANADEQEPEAKPTKSKSRTRRRSKKPATENDVPEEMALADEIASEDDLEALAAMDGAEEETPLDDPHDKIDRPEEVETENPEIEEEIRPAPSRKRTVRPHNRYKIQEVIKPRQILLVQVVKEERGNKGAALTTYISLPGRYCVLMPNTARGGGISRKISNIGDRKRLRTLAKGFKVPQGAGLIIRTAGAKKDADEIERDYAFLTRQWNQIRELTLSSTAPAAVYEESGPIKRAIRDLLTNDTDEILVEGERGYAEAREYVEVLMPDRVKSVKHYHDKMPLFSRYQVENYLSSMFNPVVQLKSGGYLVIGITEALVAIDVNSGRSTKEASIEDTALKTNLEAAEEVARQLKLRDLAGLIVIDFIDMEQYRHQQEVENKLKDCLRKDRARIQVGRISSFGLLEMSRQRLRTGLVEAITTPCPHCQGTGITRSDDSMALNIIRAIEEEIARGRSNEINASVSPAIANYLFNEKRDYIFGFFDQYGVLVRITADPALHNAEYNIEKIKNPSRPMPKAEPVSASSMIEQSQNGDNGESNNGSNGQSNKRRRRRGGRGRKKDNAQNNNNANQAQDANSDAQNADANTGANAGSNPSGADQEAKADANTKPKRGRKKATPKDGAKDGAQTSTAENAAENTTNNTEASANPQGQDAQAQTSDAKPKRKRRTKAQIEADKLAAANAESSEEPKPKAKRSKKAKSDDASAEEKPKKPRTSRAKKAEAEQADSVQSEAKTEENSETAPAKPKRRTRSKAKSTAESGPENIGDNSGENTGDNNPQSETKSEPNSETKSESFEPETKKPEKKPAKKRTGWWSL